MAEHTGVDRQLELTPLDDYNASLDVLPDSLGRPLVARIRIVLAALQESRASASAPPEKGHVLACMSGRHSFYSPSDGPERCRWCGVSASALSPEPTKQWEAITAAEIRTGLLDTFEIDKDDVFYHAALSPSSSPSANREPRAIGYCEVCREWKSQSIGQPCRNCQRLLIDWDGASALQPKRGRTDD